MGIDAKLSLCLNQLLRPDDLNYQDFWVDFNTASKRISLFCQQQQPTDSATSQVRQYNGYLSLAVRSGHVRRGPLYLFVVLLWTIHRKIFNLIVEIDPEQVTFNLVLVLSGATNICSSYTSGLLCSRDPKKRFCGKLFLSGLKMSLLITYQV